MRVHVCVRSSRPPAMGAAGLPAARALFRAAPGAAAIFDTRGKQAGPGGRSATAAQDGGPGAPAPRPGMARPGLSRRKKKIN